MLNFSSDLYKSGWLDLVFTNRNKNYGAYRLRSESATITLRALFITVPLFVLLFAGPMIYNRFNPGKAVTKDLTTVIEIRDLTMPPLVQKIKPAEKLEQPKLKPVKEKIKMVKLPSNPVVTSDPVLADPPLVTAIENAVAGPVTQSGTETNLTAVPSADNSTGTGTGKNTADNEIHDIGNIDMYPEFEGGMKAWAKFIQRNLRYPVMAQENGAQGKVFLSFVIEKDGSVSNVTILKGIGSGCDEEAMRVIRKSPKWKPGKQNNQNVRVRYTMPLSFTLSNN